MRVLMIGLGLGGTCVVDSTLLEMEHLFAHVMVYEIYRAIVEEEREEATCYVGKSKRKVDYAERIAVEALRPEIIIEGKLPERLPGGYEVWARKSDLDDEVNEMKRRIREDEGLSREEKTDLLVFLDLIHEIRVEKGSSVDGGRINAFVEVLERVSRERKYIDALLMNTSRQDKSTILENQKRKAVIGVNLLGKTVELSRFDAFRIKEEDYVLFGEHVTHGGGAGWDNVIGMMMAAQEEEFFRKLVGDKLRSSVLEGRANLLVAVVFGSGGGTGSGAAPIVCKAIRDLGREDVRTVAFALLPSKEECRMRAYNSVTSLAFTSEMVSGIGLIPLEDYVKPNLPLREAYDEADTTLARFFVLLAGAEELTEIKNDIKSELLGLIG
ncbi:MAG: hypothetical protein QXO55_07735 [Candidatus Korarchaeum sp.]